MNLEDYGFWTRIYFTYQPLFPNFNITMARLGIRSRPFYHSLLAAQAGFITPEAAQKLYPKANTIHYMKHGLLKEKAFYQAGHWSFHET